MRAHLSINVTDLEKSIEFYHMVFNVHPQKRSATYAKFDLNQPSLNFSMHEVDDRRIISRVNHLGVEVIMQGEVNEWKQRLSSQGIVTVSEEGTDCCFAKQDKFWFQDPDGNSWEVFFVHEQLPVIGAEPTHIVKKAEAEVNTSPCSNSSGCC